LELRYERPAHALDVEAAAPDEVADPLSGLRGAYGISAPVRDLALDVFDDAIAFGAALGHRELRIRLALLTRVMLRAHHLRDHVSGALDDHAVPHPHIETAHFVEVV